jgi:prepilin-type N-terminal cleavage/methylation domain-containing protein
MRRQHGFTLIEIAIVLVIIGLLLGGVLKGQELITSARVRNLISQQDGIKAAYFGFQDRFRSLPGDYPGAQAFTNIPNMVANTMGGDGDGTITVTATSNEPTLAWMHMSHAGFLTGNFNMAGPAEAAGNANTPTNPYNALLQLIHDNIYGIVTGDTTPPPIRPNLKTGNQIPVEIMAEIDRKVDDGNAGRGTLRFSAFQGVAPNAPIATNCFAAATGAWLAISNQANCGGATLF